MITRFAPSPTGHLHLGHALAAHVACETARRHHGIYLLRWEDIDHTRCRPEFEESILKDLAWLGWSPDAAPLRQSERRSVYETALETLRHSGWIYPCFCSRKEIEEELRHLASAPHGPEGPLYPGRCRSLTPDRIAQHFAEGKMPNWRLDSQRALRELPRLSFSDLSAGVVPVQADRLGDVVLARRDIGVSYHVAVVVDDACQEITRVTRGCDLLESTHVHRVLQTLLDLPEPEYDHHPLVTDKHGQRLAKRHASLSLRHLRENEGWTPARVMEEIRRFL